MRPPDFWRNPPDRPGWAARALAPVAALYGAVVGWKLRSQRAYRPICPVICVGNLTLGGVGKTPVAIALLERLKAMQASPVALSRGYGGKLKGPTIVEPDHVASEVGDEPLLLARHAPTIVAKDRAAGAAACIEHGAGVIVMDDGFQNPSVAKDLSIVVVDAETGFGNGRVFPAGPLREPLAQGLARADALVVMGDGPAPAEHPVTLRARLVPALSARAKPRRVVAFAGIGRPEKFVKTLRDVGATVAEAVGYPDHHPFGEADIQALRDLAKRENAELVTTEKDYVRLAPGLRAGVSALPVEAAFEDEAALAALLAHGLRPVAA